MSVSPSECRRRPSLALYHLDLIEHADRLIGTGSPSEVDFRRAISALYYGLFHLLTLYAGRQASVGLSFGAEERIRRGINHTDIRKLCDALKDGQVPKALTGLVDIPIDRRLVQVAQDFAWLQQERHRVDYDCSAAVTVEHAVVARTIVRRALDAVGEIHATSAFRHFLAAIVHADRWTRRG